MKRGEVWWANLPMPAGRRPVVLLSRDSAYVVRENIIVVEVTTIIRSIPSEVLLSKRDGLPQRCVINTDAINTIPKSWLASRISILSKERAKELDIALCFSLQLPALLER